MSIMNKLKDNDTVNTLGEGIEPLSDDDIENVTGGLLKIKPLFGKEQQETAVLYSGEHHQGTMC